MAAHHTCTDPPVSAFTPHHTTTVNYPCYPIMHQLERHMKDAFLLPPKNSSSRYEPLPLIPHAAVTAHTDRCNDAEASLCSFTPAVIPKFELHGLRNANEIDSASRLEHDMRVATGCTGRTLLAAVTYYKDLSTGQSTVGSKIPTVAITRNTHLIWEDGKHERCSAELYEIELGLLRQLEQKLPGVIWLVNLMDAIERRSDRAVLHVRNQLDKPCPRTHGVKDVNVEWKHPRYPDYAEFLNEVSSAIPIVSLSPDSRSCDICSNNYDYFGHAPRQLECKHILCKTCFISWCEAQGADAATDPSCRHKIFTDDHMLKTLKFGASDGGIYHKSLHGNHRFNDWENFERSCADLDMQLAENLRGQVFLTINAEVKIVILQYFNHFIDQAREEPACSTPLHLQPALAPEADNLTATLTAALDRYTGAKMPAYVLYDDLLNDFEASWYFQFVCCNMQRHMHHSEFSNLSNNASAKTLGLRPGFMAFVRRMLNRTLMALVKRRVATGFEGRGLRTFYVLAGLGVELNRINTEVADGAEDDVDSPDVSDSEEEEDHAPSPGDLSLAGELQTSVTFSRLQAAEHVDDEEEDDEDNGRIGEADLEVNEELERALWASIERQSARTLPEDEEAL